MKKIITPALVLFIVCFVVTLLLAFTNSITKDVIANAEKQKLMETQTVVLPQADSFKDSDAGNGASVGYNNGEIVGYTFTVVVKGYGGNITVLTGIDKNGIIQGVSVISQTETAGLGAKTQDSAFVDQFKGKNADEALVVKENIDAVTGATISSKAVTKAVNTACEQFKSIGGASID